MADYQQYVDLDNLEDGGYYLDDRGSFSEAVRFASAEFNKLIFQKIRLPDGKSNIIYLMTDTFENSFSLINSKYFMIPPTYRKFFYPVMSFGTFFGRRYRMNLAKLRTERMKLIRANTKMMPYPTKRIGDGDKTNIFFATGDIYQVIAPIVSKFPIKRVCAEFYRSFYDIISGFTPTYNDMGKPDKNSGNRIMLFDAECFGFKPGAPLAENKTNPLFLLYLAYFRTRDLTTIGVDLDMLITSKNMFLKFNPARLTTDKFNKFRNALFRIMKANLDNYCDQLSDDEQEELNVTPEDSRVKTLVDRTTAVFTKPNSPAVKGIVSAAVSDKLAGKATAALSREKEIAAAKADLVRRTDPKHVRLFDQVISQNRGPLLSVTDQFVHGDHGTSVPSNMPSPTGSNINYRPEPTTGKPSVFRGDSPDALSKLYQAIRMDYQPLLTSTDDDIVVDDELEHNRDDMKEEIFDILTNDDEVAEEILDAVQEQIVPMSDPRTAPVNSARDAKLREAQKKVVVKDSTIEEILAIESSNVPIITEDKSAALKTSNPNVKQITFANFDKTYIDELYTKDILACFDCLKDKSSPLYVKSVKIEDTSDVNTLRDTWTVVLEDETGNEHTFKVDIPKFYDNRFMRIGGNKWIILKQNFYNPLVKDTPDTVVITTNRKTYVNRKATASFVQVERIFSLSRKKELKDTEIFMTGDSTKVNSNYVSSLEYDEIGRRLFKFSAGKCNLYFNRHYIHENILPKFNDSVSGDEFLIGFEGKHPVIINERTGLDRGGRTIVEVITENLPEEYQRLLGKIKARKQPMLAVATMGGTTLTVGVILGVWVGITRMLDGIGMRWEFHRGSGKAPSNTTDGYLAFADGILQYEPTVCAQLIINGLNAIEPKQFNFDDLNSHRGYLEYLAYKHGTRKFQNQLMNLYEFFIDPISKEVCQHHSLPTEADLLMIAAVELLADNGHVSKASDKSYRVRSVEIIPSILYTQIQKQYQKYVNSGYKEPMTIPRDLVIKILQDQPTVDEYSTLNPAIELGKAHAISAKGYSGANKDRMYDEEKRSYDETSIGKLAISSSPKHNWAV